MIRDKVFISYSRKDEKWLDKIVNMMQPFVDQGLDLWSDKRIIPGQNWKDEINASLASAKVAVLLVSPNFLASQFIKEQELPTLLEAAGRDKVAILCVLIDHCNVDDTPIYDYHFLLEPKKPLRAYGGANQTKALKQIALEIKKAWQSPTWSEQLADDPDAGAAIQRLRALASDFAARPPVDLDRCIRQAMQGCYGPQALTTHFPQLASKPQLGWAVMLEFFGPMCKPAPEFLEALQRQLASQASTSPASNEKASHTYVALVLQWKGNNSRSRSYYTWKAFVHDPSTQEFQPIELSAIGFSSQSVVFDRPRSDQNSIACLLSHVYAWTKRHTRLPVLEIFAPFDLLDAAWAEQVVEIVDKEEICLMEALPYWLRSTDRLGEEFNSNRPRLSNKLESLDQGKGRWSAGPNAANPKFLRASVVEQDDVVGVKHFDSFSGDDKQRQRWLRALLSSMVPIAVWCRHSPRSSKSDDWHAHLDQYSMLSGHKDGDPVAATCACYAQIASERKRFQVQDPRCAQLVLMLDHIERSPKLSAEERGTSRAVSPDSR